MATAEELLASMNLPEEHIVVNADRTITVPDRLKRIAVQHDHNIETVTFDCPRYWDGHDMSTMKVYINYKLSNGYLDSYYASDVTVDEADENIMHFTWTISRNVTQVSGTITFLVCTKKVDADGDENLHWNSELNSDLKVSTGLECDEKIVEQHSDVITHILTLMGESGGLAPVATVEEVAEGVRLTVTDKDGTTTALIRHGTASLSETDMNDIVNRVLARIPNAEEGVY